MDEKLGKVEKLTDALAMIESSGVRGEEAGKVLDALGYTSVWEGMEMEKVRISKRVATAKQKPSRSTTSPASTPTLFLKRGPA